MRITIATVGPLLDQIGRSEQIPVAMLGSLGSIPLITWAIISPLAHSISTRFGLSRTVTWSLAVLTVGTIWRSLPGAPANLWFGTALIGASLAIGNVLMPAIIKRDFGTRVPLVTGVFSASVAFAGAVASGLMVPLSTAIGSEGGAGWRVALLASGALAPVALIVWSVVLRNAPSLSENSGDLATHGAQPPRRSVWFEPLGWQIAIYMGAQSTVFYTLLIWLVAFEGSRGHSELLAGVDTMILQLTGILGSTSLPLLFRGRARRWLPALLPILLIVLSVGLLSAPSYTALWVSIGGVGLGATYTMSLTLMAVRSRDHRAASAVSGMAQSVGYGLAAVGPLLFGTLHAWTGGWHIPFAMLIVVTLVQITMGLLLGRPRYLFDDSRHSKVRN